VGVNCVSVPLYCNMLLLCYSYSLCMGLVVVTIIVCVYESLWIKQIKIKRDLILTISRIKVQIFQRGIYYILCLTLVKITYCASTYISYALSDFKSTIKINYCIYITSWKYHNNKFVFIPSYTNPSALNVFFLIHISL
jgi:hypothetical protein